MSPILLACALYALLTDAQQTPLQSKGETFTLAGISYYASPMPVSQFSLNATLEIASQLARPQSAAKEFVPFSVMPTAQHGFRDADLELTTEIWKAKDDVWSTAFLRGKWKTILLLYSIDVCGRALHRLQRVTGRTKFLSNDDYTASFRYPVYLAFLQ